MNKIGYKIILLTIVLLNIFIGSNIKNPIWIIQAIVSIFSLIYIITKKIQKEKNIIIKGKIDIAVIVVMLSTAIPLVIHKYVSLEGTINFILKYWSVYGLYILTRNIVKEEKQINGIKIALIISSIIPIIIGYDMLTKNMLKPILEKIDAVQIEDTRMVSTFGYANTLAAYLGLTTSLAIGMFIKSDKKKKILYGIYILIASITILLTQSKFAIALLAFIIFLFIIKGIIDKKIGKKWIILGSITLMVFLIYLLIAMNIGRPPVVNKDGKICGVRNLEKNTEYELDFDIEAITDRGEDSFEIDIVEITRYLSEKKLASLKFGNFNGTKTLKIKTTENLNYVEIRIKNECDQKILINEFRVNGSPYILEHKIIPESVLRIFTLFNFQNSSVWQRGDFWKDSIKIIKNGGMFGTGGNTWRYSYGRVQEYLYYAKECHSYILEILMSFGVLGFISYICIIVISIKNGIKQKNRILSILVGISIVTIHSLMDFDMSFFIMEMIFYMFIAIINKDDVNLKKCDMDWIDIAVTIFMIIISVGNVLGLGGQIIKDDTYCIKSKIVPWDIGYQYKRTIYMYEKKYPNDEVISCIKDFIKKEPYCYQRIMYDIITELDLNDEDVKYFIDVWKNVEMERPYDIVDVRTISDDRLQILEKTQNVELKKQIAYIIEDDYQKYVGMFLNNAKNQKTDFMNKYEFEYYTNNYVKATDIIKELE